MKLGTALDQIEDAIEAAHSSLKMVRWAQVNVARYVGGILGAELNANIRAIPLDVERLWESAQISRKSHPEQTRALNEIIDHHNQRILDVIMAHDEHVEADSHGTAGR